MQEQIADPLIILLASMAGNPNAESCFYGSIRRKIFWDADEHLESQQTPADYSYRQATVFRVVKHLNSIPSFT